MKKTEDWNNPQHTGITDGKVNIAKGKGIKNYEYWKKFVILLIVTMILCSLVGCRKVVNTEEKEVEVTITDTHYRGSRSIPQRIGKTTTIRVSPAEYNVYVTYEGKTYTIDNEELYDQYKDCVGETVIGILKTVTYDDGSINSQIVGLK